MPSHDASARPTRRAALLRGIPALAGLLPVGGPLGFAHTGHAKRSAELYSQQLRRAMPEGRHQVVLICIGRLLDQGGRSAKLFWIWQGAAQKDRPVLAEELLKMLAPRERQGLPLAHLKLAHLLASNADGDHAALELARIHCTRATGPTVPTAHVQAFDTFLAALLEDPDASKLARRAASAKAPDDPVLFSAINLILGHEGRAAVRARTMELGKVIARRLLKRGGHQIATKPSNMRLVRHLVRANEMLGRYDAATALLERAIANVEDPQTRHTLRQILGRTYVRWAGSSKAKVRRIELLGKALEQTPDHMMLAELLRLDGFSKRRLEAMIQGKLRGKDSLRMSFAYGSALVSVGRAEEGARLLEGVHQRLKRKNHSCANNLAAGLLALRSPDPERALQLIDEALRQSDEPAYHETRGRALVLLRRTSEGIKELEYAIRHLPPRDRHETYLHLAKAYDQLGQAAIARRYRKEAAAWRKRSETLRAWLMWGADGDK